VRRHNLLTGTLDTENMIHREWKISFYMRVFMIVTIDFIQKQQEVVQHGVDQSENSTGV